MVSLILKIFLFFSATNSSVGSDKSTSSTSRSARPIRERFYKSKIFYDAYKDFFRLKFAMKYFNSF